MALSLRCLLLSTEVGRFEAVLRPKFPDVTFLPCRTVEEVHEALKQNPEVAFTNRERQLPLEVHRLVASYPSIKLFQVAGSGFDHILGLPPREDRVVTNAVGALAPFLAETIVTAFLALNRDLLRAHESQKGQTWERFEFPAIRGQTLVLIGFGAVARAVARIARSMGMHIIAVRRDAVEDPDVDEVFSLDCLDDVLPRGDVISIHTPLTSETEHLIDRRRIALMKPSAIFCNTARGLVADEEAIADALHEGKLRGAYLDVFAIEPLPESSRLWRTPRLILTPHNAGTVHDWLERFAEVFAENLHRYLTGQDLVNIVSRKDYEAC